MQMGLNMGVFSIIYLGTEKMQVVPLTNMRALQNPYFISCVSPFLCSNTILGLMTISNAFLQIRLAPRHITQQGRPGHKNQHHSFAMLE